MPAGLGIQGIQGPQGQTAAERRRKSCGAYQHLNTQYTDEARYWLVETPKRVSIHLKKEVKDPASLNTTTPRGKGETKM